jgi:3-oxoacyl-[acyl-carrier protein] reductase
MVTGGAAGIGRVTAENFAGEGARIAICDVNPEAGEAAAKALGKYGQIDVLINNAGITRDGLIMRMKEEDWDAVISVNLKSAFNCIKSVSKIMVKQRSGRIINLASVVGVMGNVGQANYVASKAGMIGLTKTVAKELGARGITVNAVAPGFIETDMTAVLSDKVKAFMLSMVPLQRAGTPQDVADAIAFLASDQAAYITGQVVHVTGGMYM